MKYFVLRDDGSREGPFEPAILVESCDKGLIGAETELFPEDGSPPLTLSQLETNQSASSSDVPPPLPSAAPEKERASRSWVIPLVICVVVVVVGLVAVAGVVGYLVNKVSETAFDQAIEALEEVHGIEQASLPLLEDREGHQTEWLPEEGESEPTAPTPPEAVLSLVTYPAPVGNLPIYVTPDPGDGKKHPAVVWAKGGFGGLGSYFWQSASRLNDQTARAFRDAGIVTLYPSFRGHNDNPGRREFFYGEVDDFLAAVKFARSLPHVDPERVYIAGHSVGGSIVLLAGGAGADYRAGFSFGGDPLINYWDDYDNRPYDEESDAAERENELRSAIRYTRFIENPMFYFEGEDNWSDPPTQMAKVAKEHGTPFESFKVKGDHWNILAPITKLVAEKILADTGATCAVSFTTEELNAAWSAMHDITLTSELERWMKDGGDLREIVLNLEDDGIPENAEDIATLKTAVEKTLPKTDEQGLADLAELADIGVWIPASNTEVKSAYDIDVVPLFRQWVADTARAHPEKIEKPIARPFFTVLACLLRGGDMPAFEMLNQFAADNYLPDHGGWPYLFDKIDVDELGWARGVEHFRAHPVSGSIGGALVERANEAYFNDYEGLHPYDSEGGARVLRSWLEPGEGGGSDHAFEAALALAFISENVRGDLIQMGMSHPRTSVRLEAAWSDVKGRDGKVGLPYLQKMCGDLSFAQTAANYLRELGRDADIPKEALEPDFVAKAAMVHWLKHPNELGQAPLSIEQFDVRELRWPPSKEEVITARLFRFTYRFDKGPVETAYGMTGSTTWSSFRKYSNEPTPDQLYVHHCALELAQGVDGKETELDASRVEALELLRKANPGQFDNVEPPEVETAVPASKE